MKTNAEIVERSVPQLIHDSHELCGELSIEESNYHLDASPNNPQFMADLLQQTQGHIRRTAIALTAMSERIAELEHHKQLWKQSAEGTGREIVKMRDRATAAETANAGLREALQPFAEAALESRDNWRKQDGEMAAKGIPDDADCAVTFTQGQLNRAEAALAAEGKAVAPAERVPQLGYDIPMSLRVSSATPPAISVPVEPSDGVARIAAERKRQIEVENWNAVHDAEHDAGELASAAAAYALNAACVLYPENGTPLDEPPIFWMWDKEWWKPKDPLRDLERAGALIAAEIDKLLSTRP
jgi:hypothetical protein